MMDEILVPSFMEQTAFMVAPSNLAHRWIKYVYLAGMEDVLSDPTMVATFLVPSNDAFEAVDKDTTAFLESPQGKEDLGRVLMSHIIPGVVVTSSSTLEQGLESVHKTMVENRSLRFHTTSSSVLQIDTASVVKGDIIAANGIVHVIDQVLLPARVMRVEVDGTTKPEMF